MKNMISHVTQYSTNYRLKNNKRRSGIKMFWVDFSKNKQEGDTFIRDRRIVDSFNRITKVLKIGSSILLIRKRTFNHSELSEVLNINELI